jgi:hypothetical protein
MALPILNRIFTRKPAQVEETNHEESMLVVSDEDAHAYIVRNLEGATNELEKIYYSHKGRRILKWHHYLSIYDRHFQPYKTLALDRLNNSTNIAPEGKLRILEIGVQNGGSLQMWRRYFDAKAVIFGIDIDPRCKEFEEEDCQIRIGDQSDPTFLRSVIDEMGGIDIVIDDGSHIASHQLASFRFLFPLLVQEGIYICEDLHTSYWDDWEGGYKKDGTFIEFTKDIIDNMHEWYFHNPSATNDLNLKKIVLGVSVYDSVVVIEKGNKERPYAVHVGQNSFC